MGPAVRVGTTAVSEAPKAASTTPEGPKAKTSTTPTKAAARESPRVPKAIAVLRMLISFVVVSDAEQALVSSPGQTEKVGHDRLVTFAVRPSVETKAGPVATSREMSIETMEVTAIEGMASLVAVGHATTVVCPVITLEVCNGVGKATTAIV